MDLNAFVQWFEIHLQTVPISTLHVWGQFAFIIGIILMICAYSGFTPQPGGKWGFGWQRSTWDSTSFYSILITFVLIISAGFAGSFIVLVPGAQTFESAKDLCVFICVLLFGYPALIAVPFAYGVSDLVEGVPPDFLQDWLIGYFINPSVFWIAAVLFGKDPDFRKFNVWAKYFLFVFLFMLIEPFMWGYICVDKYSAEVSYRNITPALFFTTSITWLMAPLAMLVALPLSKKLGLFWADIPLHAREKMVGKKELLWISGPKDFKSKEELEQGVPIRIVLVVPFFVLVLSLVSVTAYFTLRSSESNAYQLAMELHEEITDSIKTNLTSFLGGGSAASAAELNAKLDALLKQDTIAGNGRAFIIDRSGNLIASSEREISGENIEKKFIEDLTANYGGLRNIRRPAQHRFEIIKTRPLVKEAWLVKVAPFSGIYNSFDWLIVTALPQNYYLRGVRTGSSQSALVFSAAIVMIMIIVGLLSKVVTFPLKRLSAAAQLIADGQLNTSVPGSQVQELNTLSLTFNRMAERLKLSIDALNAEIIKRMTREKELEDAQKRLLENEGRLQMAITAAELGIWDWDIKSGKLIWDDVMFSQYGMKSRTNWTFDEWLLHVIPEDRNALAEQVKKALKDNQDYSAEYRVRWSDHSVHYLRGVGRTIFDDNGKAKRMVGVNFDITKLKNTERELIASRDEALAANKAKSDFLANMSHEIRTPLNTILGMSSVLSETPLNEKQRKCVNIANNSSEHLLHLINDIIDANIIESRGITLDLSNFDLHKVVHSTVDFLTTAAEKKGIQISGRIGDGVPKFVVGDEHRLRQILINLLGNAVKFTEKGSVELRVERDLKSVTPHALTFAVKDTGIGIAPEQKKVIFERFTQGNSSLTRKHEGTGLGLSISKYLIELMGGKVKVESTPGEGSCFYFTIGLEPGVTETEQPVQSELLDLHGLTVLIVDDSEDNRTLLQYYLSKSKCNVELATDGAEAIKKFETHHYDMIFMDIQMPGIDGYTATKEIRRIESFRHLGHTPIAALTAFALKEEIQKSYDAGCDLHITKPVKKSVILSALSQIHPTTFH